MTSMTPEEFCFEDLVLNIYSDAYLVKVETDHPFQPFTQGLVDLPDWIFASRNAIWLTNEEAPLRLRAEHGDLIRKRLSVRVRASKVATS